MTFVPGVNSRLGALQLVKLLPETALLQPVLLSWYQTLVTRTLSPALPVAVKSWLLQRWFARGVSTMLTGRVTSRKFAVKLRLDCMLKTSLAAVVARLPDQSVNLNPFAAVAVME